MSSNKKVELSPSEVNLYGEGGVSKFSIHFLEKCAMVLKTESNAISTIGCSEVAYSFFEFSIGLSKGYSFGVVSYIFLK
jgi:hypothetical protein